MQLKNASKANIETLNGKFNRIKIGLIPNPIRN